MVVENSILLDNTLYISCWLGKELFHLLACVKAEQQNAYGLVRTRKFTNLIARFQEDILFGYLSHKLVAYFVTTIYALVFAV